MRSGTDLTHVELVDELINAGFITCKVFGYWRHDYARRP
jgi:hypothetical protein